MIGLDTAAWQISVIRAISRQSSTKMQKRLTTRIGIYLPVFVKWPAGRHNRYYGGDIGCDNENISNEYPNSIWSTKTLLTSSSVTMQRCLYSVIGKAYCQLNVKRQYRQLECPDQCRVRGPASNLYFRSNHPVTEDQLVILLSLFLISGRKAPT
jgi:hypothetical protein